MKTMDEDPRLEDYLAQGEVWMSVSGPVKISTMDQVYRRRALRWLERNSGHLFTLLTVERYVRRYDGGRESLEEMIQWVDTRPSTWITDQPLYQALAEGALRELRSR